MNKESQLLSKSLPAFLSFLALTLILAVLATPAHSADVTLAWDPNSEPDLAGYRVYYKEAFSGPPYNGSGATEGDSPIDVGNVTEFTVHGLTDGVTYFFVVTAYDTEGFESGYSNEVATNGHTPSPTINSAEDEGAGCFICTAAFTSQMCQHPQILNNDLGQTFIALYTKLFAPIGDFVNRHPCSNAALGYGLIPTTETAYFGMYTNPWFYY